LLIFPGRSGRYDPAFFAPHCIDDGDYSAGSGAYRQRADFSISVGPNFDVWLRQCDRRFVEIDTVLLNVALLFAEVPFEPAEFQRLDAVHEVSAS
jgi:hypothetical protein